MRETAAAIIAGLCLVVVVILVWALALQSLAGNVQYVDAEGEPRLRFIWRALVWVATGGDTVAKIFTGLVVIVGISIPLLAQIHKRVWSVVLVCIICLLGVAGCVIVMVVISEQSGSVITTIRGAAGGAEASLRGSIQVFMGLVFAWFVTFLGAQLGISAIRPDGALPSPLQNRGNNDQGRQE